MKLHRHINSDIQKRSKHYFQIKSPLDKGCYMRVVRKNTKNTYLWTRCGPNCCTLEHINQFVGLLLALVLHEFCTQLLQSKETPHKIDPLSSPATFCNFLLRGTLILCPLKSLRHRALDPSMSHSHLYIGWMRVF